MTKQQREHYVNSAIQRIHESERQSLDRFSDLQDPNYLVSHRGSISAKRVG